MELISIFRGNGLPGLDVLLKEDGDHINQTQISYNTLRSVENVKLQTGIFQELKTG